MIQKAIFKKTQRQENSISKKLSEVMDEDIKVLKQKIWRKKGVEIPQKKRLKLFWEQQPIPMDPLASYQFQSLYDIVMQTMRKKVSDLIEIMMSDDDEVNVGVLGKMQKIVENKACQMVHSLFHMDKVRWFQLLRVEIPTAPQLQHVQTLQLRLRSLRRNPTKEGITQLCKRILTTDQLKNALEDLMTD